MLLTYKKLAIVRTGFIWTKSQGLQPSPYASPDKMANVSIFIRAKQQEGDYPKIYY
jgi:hypothetical protein